MTDRGLTNQEMLYKQEVLKLVDSSPKRLISSAPNLFTSRTAVQSLITRYELYKLISNVPGDIIECGVYQGNTFLWLAHLSVILEPFSICRRLIGFDTFSGFSSIDAVKDPSDISENVFSDTSYEVVMRALQSIDLVRPVSTIPRFELIKGDIVETVPKYLKDNDWMTCAMLILDTDLYLPTKVALDNIIPIMPSGSIIVFDEYNYSRFPGETNAIKECLALRKLAVRRFSYESCTAYAVV